MKYRGEDDMALSDDFKEAVLQDKKTKVRIMMKDSLLLDFTGTTFDEMAKFADKPGFIDEHNGEVFKSSEEWDEDYLNEQMVAVVNNFSAERIDLLKKMVKKLYGKDSEPSGDCERNNHVNNQDYSRKTSVPVIKVAGGIAATLGAGTLIYGIVAEAPIIVPVVGGAAIVAGACLLLKK